MKKVLALFFLPLLSMIGACAQFSPEVIQGADQRVTISDIQKAPERYLNRPVVWGGVIVEAVNRQDGSWVVVSKTDLDHFMEPKDIKKTEGDFIIRSGETLDVGQYQSGRLVTVAGDIAGVQSYPEAAPAQAYPVVKPRQIHLWEEADAGRNHFYWTKLPTGGLMNHSGPWAPLTAKWACFDESSKDFHKIADK